MSAQSTGPIGDDLMIGAAAIAEFLGLERRKVYKFVERGHLPIFRIGSLVCARRSTVIDWIARQEQDAMPADEPQPDQPPA